jgi:hypothetical protein
MDGKVIVNRDNKFYVVGFDVDDDGEIVVGDEMVEVERGPWIPVIKECCGKRATIRLKGGAGSGNFGHGGRPGKIGGSSSSGGGGGGDDGTKGDRKHGKKSATHWANTMRDYSSRIDEAAKSKKLAKVFSDGLASESKIALKAERHVTSKRIAEAKLFFDNGEIRDAKKVLDAIASEMENKSK